MAEADLMALRARRIRAFRCFFWVSALQVLLFFLVPALTFPVAYVLHVEIISALTVGLVVAVFFGMVNLCGLAVDRRRRLLYGATLVVVGSWLIWAAVSWTFIHRMDYILR